MRQVSYALCMTTIVVVVCVIALPRPTPAGGDLLTVTIMSHTPFGRAQYYAPWAGSSAGWQRSSSAFNTFYIDR